LESSDGERTGVADEFLHHLEATLCAEEAGDPVEAGVCQWFREGVEVEGTGIFIGGAVEEDMISQEGDVETVGACRGLVDAHALKVHTQVAMTSDGLSDPTHEGLGPLSPTSHEPVGLIRGGEIVGICCLVEARLAIIVEGWIP